MGGTLPRPTCRCMSSWVRASIIVSDSVTVMFVDGGRATLVGAQIALESPFISKKMRERINHRWCCGSDVTESIIHKQSKAHVLVLIIVHSRRHSSAGLGRIINSVAYRY